MIRKVLTEQEVNMYGKNIQNMFKEITNSFKKYVNEHNRKESLLQTPHKTASAVYDSSKKQSNVFFPTSPLPDAATHQRKSSNVSNSSYTSSTPTSHLSPTFSAHRRNLSNSSSNKIVNEDSAKHPQNSSGSSITIPALESLPAFLLTPQTSPSEESSEMTVPVRVPRLLISLEAALNRVHGWEFEGIFRVPGSKQKIEDTASMMSYVCLLLISFIL